jgi:5'-nucleotidase
MKPYILITNDDGINSPGIKHLWEALASIADLVIIAPDSEKSASGLALTVREPIWTREIEWPGQTVAWSINGTPADCVKLGLSSILKRRPDLVVSGINRGSNAGRNVLYSGTVGGAIESTMQNVPAIAVSCREYYGPDYAAAAKHVPKIVEHVLECPMPPGTFLNVNFPSINGQEIKGFKMARQGMEFWKENPTERKHPIEGHTYFWLGAQIASFEEAEDSDIAWLNRGYAAAVPVHVWEMTDHAHLSKHQSTFEKKFL